MGQEHKAFVDEIDALRAESIQKQNEITKLKDEKTDLQNILCWSKQVLEKQAKELSTLREEAKKNRLEMERIKEENHELLKKSMDDAAEEENDEGTKTSGSIKQLQDVPLSEVKAMQGEEQFVDKRLPFYQTGDISEWKTKALVNEGKVTRLETEIALICCAARSRKKSPTSLRWSGVQKYFT